MTERVVVKRLKIGVGMQADGQVVSVNHAAAENKKIFVVPGRFAAIEMTNPATGVVTTAEVPLGPFGWEYEAL